MPKVEVIGVYPVEAPEPVYLIEMWIRGAEGLFELCDITQEVPGQPPSNWQVPYSEYILSPLGDKVLTEEFEATERPELWRGDVRLAFFFHYLSFERPLRTPFGEVRLPAESDFPARLSEIKYEPPC